MTRDQSQRRNWPLTILLNDDQGIKENLERKNSKLVFLELVQEAVTVQVVAAAVAPDPDHVIGLGDVHARGNGARDHVIGSDALKVARKNRSRKNHADKKLFYCTTFQLGADDFIWNFSLL